MNERHVGARDNPTTDACLASERTYFVGSAQALNVEHEFVSNGQVRLENFHLSHANEHPNTYGPPVSERFVAQARGDGLSEKFEGGQRRDPTSFHERVVLTNEHRAARASGLPIYQLFHDPHGRRMRNQVVYGRVCGRHGAHH